MQSTKQMIHVKATFGQDIRRFETEVTYSTLVDTLRKIYRLPTSNDLNIKFLDDDQDWITFSSDAEFEHAFELKLNPLKLTFQISDQQAVTTSVPTDSTSCERRGRCHLKRRSLEGRRGCHLGRRGEMKGCHEGRRGFCGGRTWGNEEEPKRGICGKKVRNCRRGTIEGRIPHRRHHFDNFERNSTCSPAERITRRINMIKSKLEKGVKDEKVEQILTFRLAKLQWKLEFIQQIDGKKIQEITEKCVKPTPSKGISELKEEKRSFREQLRAARKNEDEESILRLREALRSKKCAIRKLKSESFENKDACCGRRRKMFRTCEPSPDLENFKLC